MKECLGSYFIFVDETQFYCPGLSLRDFFVTERKRGEK